jgi:Ca2+-binding RTX toxin-like protein
MAITAFFTASAGLLSIFSDNLNNTVTVSRDAAGTILVNVGAVPVQGGLSTVANTALIQAFGLGGNDNLRLDESNGALPASHLFGGFGHDTVTGGSGGDLLFGQSDNDVILGKGGFDALFGGSGNDTLTGGDADDQMFGESGDDRMIWNPGDDSDLMEGGAGIDTAEVNGGSGAEVFSVTANGARVRFDRLDPAPFAIDIGTSENLVLNANGGNDFFSATGNLAALIKLTVDGGAGNDTILGSNGVDVLLGGDGDDFIDGQQGNDVAFLGAGNDTFQWDPGDGSDVVEGQDDTDTMRFNGSGGNEIFEASANGGRVLFTRNLGNIVMDLDDVEVIDLNALGGADTVTVNDLSGTDVAEINVDLAGVIGGTAGDGQADTVIANGTNGDDLVDVVGAGSSVSVIGLAAQVNVSNSEGANDTLVINALGGDDKITATALPAGIAKLTLDGGAGDDTVTGSAGADRILGQAGDDVLLGGGGTDSLFGGDGNDTLTGGDADDQAFGEAGDDRMIWNPGDDTDLFEGGDGIDTAEVNGGGGGEVFSLTANGARVRFDRLDPAPFSIDIGTTEKLVLNANSGDDFFSATGNLAALIQLTVDGGAGNDTILGSNGKDVLLGGDGDDFIDGQQGDDVAFLGAGNDTFQWDPGDGSDVVEGQDGTDTMRFNGSGGDEIFEASANGGRALFTRNLGNIVMDLDDVEVIDLNTLGGNDTVTVNDLSGTDVVEVNIDLAGVIGGTAGDGKADTVITNGTNGDDIVEVVGAGSNLSVIGLAAQINVSNSEGANDALVINALGGDDVVTATTLPAGIAKLTIDGGAGDDTILGSQGADVLLGGAGNDSVFGDNGNDVAFLGAGDDAFQWDPGDGNDTVEGQDGVDTLLFNGSSASENIDIFANGGRAIFFRNVANVTMDLNDVEAIDFNALGGVDNIVVGDLSGTDVTKVDIDLAAVLGGTVGDKQVDTVTTNGTNGDDLITVASVGSQIVVGGLQAQVVIDHAEAGDKLVINGLGGDDVINASGLDAGKMALQVNAGLGDDVVIGSEGNDTVNGGDGDDTALLGAGDDVFVWNPGDDDDTIEGQDGTDTMLFNGSGASENIDIFANGGRVLFTRNIANVTMDLNDVETVEFNALGGADNINVGDLSGTDVELVDIDLAATIGGTAGDGQPDSVTVNATNGDDIVVISSSGSKVSVDGVSAQVTVDHAEAGDKLVINGLAGDDVFEASSLAPGKISLQLFAGAGDDVVVGSAGSDLIDGGAGDDVLIGGDGNDTISGGAGDDVIIHGSGNNTFVVSSPLDGHDIISGFDGDAAGGQDTLNLDALFDGLGVAAVDRTARVSVADNGASVNVSVDADGNAANGFEFIVATLNTADAITVGADVTVVS